MVFLLFIICAACGGIGYYVETQKVSKPEVSPTPVDNTPEVRPEVQEDPLETFVTNAKAIYKTAQQQWINDSLNGTTYDSTHVTGEYARVDTTLTPGYFTLK